MKNWNLESTRATVLLHLGLFAMVSAVVLFSERSAPPAAWVSDTRAESTQPVGALAWPVASPPELLLARASSTSGAGRAARLASAQQCLDPLQATRLLP